MINTAVLTYRFDYILGYVSFLNF